MQQGYIDFLVMMYTEIFRLSHHKPQEFLNRQLHEVMLSFLHLALVMVEKTLLKYCQNDSFMPRGAICEFLQP